MTYTKHNENALVAGIDSSIVVLITHLRNGFNFRAQFVFNAMKSESIFISDEVNSDTQVSKPAGTTNTMQICFGHFRKIEINNHVHGLDVDTAREQICGSN